MNRLPPDAATVLKAVWSARISSGALAPHLYSIAQHIPPRYTRGRVEMGVAAIRKILLALDEEGFVERQGNALEFALTEKGQGYVDWAAARANA